MKLEEEYMGERVPAEGSVGAISYLDLICQSGKRDPKIVVNWCAPIPFLSPYLRSLWTQFSPSSNPSPPSSPALHSRTFTSYQLPVLSSRL